MKKTITAVLLAAILMLSLCVPAFAAEATADGIYNVTITPGSTLEVTYKAMLADGTSVESTSVEVDGAAADNYYAGAVKLEITVSGVQNGDFALILAQNDEGVPTEGNIVYIDQYTVSGSSVIFTVYPSELSSGTTYHVYVSTSSLGKQEVLTFRYFQAYKLGDVNGDKSITTADALAVLEHIAQITTLTDAQKLPADTTHDGNITTADALAILEHIAQIKPLS